MELKLGEKQTLVIVKKVEFGVYLATKEAPEDKVLLPAKQVPARAKAGDEVEVLAAVFCQPVFQICVVGADMDCRFFFVKPNIRGLFLFCQSCFHRNSFFALFGQEGHFSGIFLGS